LRVFAGKRSVLQRGHSRFFFLAGKFSPFSNTSRWAELMAGYKWVFDDVVSKNDCNFSVSSGDRLFPVCV
jgi:hypothetical protein